MYTVEESKNDIKNVRSAMKNVSFMPSSARAAESVAAQGVYVMQRTAKA